MIYEVTTCYKSLFMCFQEVSAFIARILVKVTTAESEKVVYCFWSFLSKQLEVKSANVFSINCNVKVHLHHYLNVRLVLILLTKCVGSPGCTLRE